MTDLTGKIAMVTGASSGIGAAIVTELLQIGMKVVGLARRKERIEKLGKGYEGNLFPLETDVTKEEDILHAFHWVEKNVGPIYALINNAGVTDRTPIDEAETDNIRRVIDTNLVALTLFTREVIRNMKANETEGAIININSISGHFVGTLPNISTYNASKFGVTAFTESIRIELAKTGSKIRIASLSPGLVKSEMTDSIIALHPHIKAQNVAEGVKYILVQPPNVNIAELTIRPVGEVI